MQGIVHLILELFAKQHRGTDETWCFNSEYKATRRKSQDVPHPTSTLFFKSW